MNVPDPYEAWREKRRTVPVDEQFADRVMERIRTSKPPPASPGLPRGGLIALGARWSAMAALLAASAVIGLLRIESVAALILLFSPEGF